MTTVTQPKMFTIKTDNGMKLTLSLSKKGIRVTNKLGKTTRILNATWNNYEYKFNNWKKLFPRKTK